MRGLRSGEPVGRTASFVLAVAGSRGPRYVASWLSPKTCQFEDCVVWTHTLGRERLYRECSDQIAAANIVIRCDDQSIAHYRAYADAIPPPTKKRKKRKS